MSRSYKKTPVCKYEKLSRYDKKQNNRRVRRKKLEEYPKGSTFKKESLEYNWRGFWSKEQAIRDFYNSKRIQERYDYEIEKYLEYWEHCVKRK